MIYLENTFHTIHNFLFPGMFDLAALQTFLHAIRQSYQRRQLALMSKTYYYFISHQKGRENILTNQITHTTVHFLWLVLTVFTPEMKPGLTVQGSVQPN